MSRDVFTGDFTQQDPLPQTSIDAASSVLASARLHRYNLAANEVGEVSQFEDEYAAWQGARYCLAVASGGQAMQIALRAVGVKAGDTVLTNAFTLAPVPGAIGALGARALYVETDENLRLDLEDFEVKSKHADYLLLSHMRGHLVDMSALMGIANTNGVTVVEDCAHTMGAAWNGVRSGNFGRVSCFSTQTYKHMNSGEGGIVITNDPEIAAQAIVMSGSYMNYRANGARPELDAFEKIKLTTPNLSARMDHLRAAILRPQLTVIDERIAAWNVRYDQLAGVLTSASGLILPRRPKAEAKVGSSLQFRVPHFDAEQCETFVANNFRRGVELKWFGASEPKGFTSNHHSWAYMPAQNLPQTDRILSTLFDIRIPLSFSIDDCELIGRIIVDEFDRMSSGT